jgi:hypothetical protein
MNIALWVVQGLLALAFLAVGGMKLFAYEKYKAMSERNGPSGLTRGLVAFIGVAELDGAIGIVLPMAVGVAPWLSAWAAVGLATVMLLAIRYHVRRREPPTTPAILFVLALFVAFAVFLTKLTKANAAVASSDRIALLGCAV